ncbi:hypothetical protein DWY99_10790, partial [[Clostridium] leptum]
PKSRKLKIFLGSFGEDLLNLFKIFNSRKLFFLSPFHKNICTKEILRYDTCFLDLSSLLPISARQLLAEAQQNP